MSSIIAVSQLEEQAFLTRVDRFFNHLKLSNVLQKCNFYKEAGFSSGTVLKELFSLVFHGKNLYRSLTSQHESLPFRKNTAYRFLNSRRFNWNASSSFA